MPTINERRMRLKTIERRNKGDGVRLSNFQGKRGGGFKFQEGRGGLLAHEFAGKKGVFSDRSPGMGGRPGEVKTTRNGSRGLVRRMTNRSSSLVEDSRGGEESRA